MSSIKETRFVKYEYDLEPCGIGDLPGRPRRKKTGGVSPNARTVKMYRERGYLVDVVERYDHHAQRLHDFLGMFDAIALRAGDTVGLQPTTSEHVAARVEKIRRSPLYAAWLATGARAVVVGWRKAGTVWMAREVELTVKTHPPLPCDPLAVGA